MKCKSIGAILSCPSTSLLLRDLIASSTNFVENLTSLIFIYFILRITAFFGVRGKLLVELVTNFLGVVIGLSSKSKGAVLGVMA